MSMPPPSPAEVLEKNDRARIPLHPPGADPIHQLSGNPHVQAANAVLRCVQQDTRLQRSAAGRALHPHTAELGLGGSTRRRTAHVRVRQGVVPTPHALASAA